jgi:ankyrin repeat protein
MLLIKNGAELNSTDDAGETPLHYAVRNKSLQLVKLLIEHKAPANIKNTDGLTPKDLAVKNNDTRILKYFTEHFTVPLHKAIEAGDIKTVSQLINDGADINAELPAERTSSIFAQGVSATDMLLNDLHKIISMNGLKDRHITPLHRAIRLNRKEIFDLLLKHNADLKKTNTLLQTPLHYAAGWDRPLMAKALIEKGADVNKKDLYRNTPLHFACNNTLGIVQTCVNNGAKTDNKNIYGESPLFNAVSSSTDTRIVEFLLQKGCALKTKDRYNNTLMHKAVAGKNKTMLRYLIGRGININATNSAGETALFVAVAENIRPLVTLLLLNWAKPGIKNNHGQTAIDVARNDLVKRTLLRYKEN